MTQYAFRTDEHPETGWQLVRLSCVDERDHAHQTVINFTPQVGSNLIDWEVDGIEYLCDIGDTEGQRKILGTPIDR